MFPSRIHLPRKHFCSHATKQAENLVNTNPATAEVNWLALTWCCFFLAQALVPPPVLFCSCSERSKCTKAEGKGKPGWRQTMNIGKHMAHRWSEEGKAFRTMLLPFLPVALGSIWGFPCAWSQSPHHYSREYLDENKAHLGEICFHLRAFSYTGAGALLLNSLVTSHLQRNAAPAPAHEQSCSRGSSLDPAKISQFSLTA